MMMLWYSQCCKKNEQDISRNGKPHTYWRLLDLVGYADTGLGMHLKEHAISWEEHMEG